MGTLTIPASKFQDFKKHLKKLGFEFEDRPHQVFLARYPGLTINLYKSGKLVMAGKDDLLKRELEFFLTGKDRQAKGKSKKKKDFSGTTRIGTDEAGKGDYFGPLVVAGVLLDEGTEKALLEMGVKDSKTLTDGAVKKMAHGIRKALGKDRYDVILIGPAKYNQLYKKIGNLNKLLAWGHARAVENLLTKAKDCSLAVADQFGDKKYIESALMKKAKKIRLVQMPKAESDTAVAAASILARDAFLARLESMGKEYNKKFPKGASRVLGFARELVKEHGKDVLEKVAKTHFRTTSQVLGKK